MSESTGFLRIAYAEDGRWKDTDRDRRFETESKATTHLLKIGMMFPKSRLWVVPEEWIGKVVEGGK